MGQNTGTRAGQGRRKILLRGMVGCLGGDGTPATMLSSQMNQMRVVDGNTSQGAAAAAQQLTRGPAGLPKSWGPLCVACLLTRQAARPAWNARPAGRRRFRHCDASADSLGLSGCCVAWGSACRMAAHMASALPAWHQGCCASAQTASSPRSHDRTPTARTSLHPRPLLHLPTCTAGKLITPAAG